MDVQIKIISNKGNQSSGRVQTQQWNEKERLKRGLQAFGKCFGLAVLSVFLPFLHYFLVPSLLIASPIYGRYIYKITSMVIDGEGTCPDCQAPFKVAKMIEQWPMHDVCDACKCEVKIEKA